MNLFSFQECLNDKARQLIVNNFHKIFKNAKFFRWLLTFLIEKIFENREKSAYMDEVE